MKALMLNHETINLTKAFERDFLASKFIFRKQVINPEEKVQLSPGRIFKIKCNDHSEAETVDEEKELLLLLCQHGFIPFWLRALNGR